MAAGSPGRRKNSLEAAATQYMACGEEAKEKLLQLKVVADVEI